jgi:DNA-binding NarL/FixJ family response regulator
VIPQTLIADPMPAVREWLAAGLLSPPGSVTGVATGWELLWQLAERPFELVVAGCGLPDVPGVSLLAMVRTAGLNTPFLLIAPFCHASVRGAVARLGAAEIVDDWTDTSALRAARDRLGVEHRGRGQRSDYAIEESRARRRCQRAALLATSNVEASESGR